MPGEICAPPFQGVNMSTRRTFLGRAFGACSALFAARGLSAQVQMQMPMPMPPPAPETKPPHTVLPHGHVMPHLSEATPVVTTDVGDLPHTIEGSVKVFRLT